MAVEMVDVYHQETGQKTRLPKSALRFWPQYKTTPAQKRDDKKKEG